VSQFHCEMEAGKPALHDCLTKIAHIFNQQEQQLTNQVKGKEEQLVEATKRIMNLEEENARLQSIAADLEKKLLLSQSENKSVQSAFNSLSLRYQGMKKAASQLEAFRKVAFSN
jgi:phage shock protein A